MEKVPAPWVYVDAGLLKSWTWKTPHFEGKVLTSGQGDGYTWSLKDITGQQAKTLAGGEEQTFTEAEELVLETVGKSYPQQLGYHKYAGELATTFSTGFGKKINFAPYSGSTVTVKVFNKTNPAQPHIITGILGVKNYKILLKTAQTNVSIIPEQILEIIQEKTSDTSMITQKTDMTAFRQILKEEWQPGCTGQPGFRAGTTLHKSTDKPCPFHRF
jgi:hypothetical protein